MLVPEASTPVTPAAVTLEAIESLMTRVVASQLEIRFTSLETTVQAQRTELLDEIRASESRMTKNTDEKLDRIAVRTDTVEQQLADMRSEMNVLRSGASSVGSASGHTRTRFVPRYVEIKNFCSFDRRATDGATKDDIKKFAAEAKRIVGLADPTLKDMIGDWEGRGLRSRSFYLWMTDADATVDVGNVLRDVLKAGGPPAEGLLLRGSAPIVIYERTAAESARMALIGSLMGNSRAALVKKSLADDWSVQAAWRTGAVFFRKGDEEKLCGTVSENGVTQLESPTLAWLGYDNAEFRRLGLRS